MTLHIHLFVIGLHLYIHATSDCVYIHRPSDAEGFVYITPWKIALIQD